MSVFYDRLFVILVPTMILGFLLGNSLALDGTLVLCGIVISLIVLVVSNRVERLSFLHLPAMLFSAISVGFIAVDEGLESGQELSVEHISGIGEVIEVRDGVWKQSVIECKYRLEENKKVIWDERILAIIQLDQVKQGDVIMFSSDLYPILNKGNPGEFDEEMYWLRKGIRRRTFIQEQDLSYLYSNDLGFIGRILNSSRNWISIQLTANLSPQNAALAHALLLGDKHLLRSEDKQVFSNAGAMHVLAVSGLHVGIIVYLLIGFLKAFKRFLTKFQIHLIAISFIWVYALMIDLPPSVNRSALMFSILILGELIERRGNTINLLFFAAFIQLLMDPFVIYDIGFQLSYLAMVGIICFYPAISKALYIKNKYLRKGWEATSIGVAAQITTFPLTLFYFHQFPNYFIISNLIVLLLAGVILGIGFAFIALIKVPVANVLVTSLFGVSLSLLFLGMTFVESIPGAVAKGFKFDSTWLVLIYAFIFLASILKGIKHYSPFIIGGGIGILVMLQFFRFENWNDEHVVVFNFNRPLIAVHKKNASLVFYDVKNEKERERVVKLIDDYSKVYPGEIKMIPLEMDVNRIGTDEMKIYTENTHYYLLFRASELEFTVRKSIKAPTLEQEKQFCLSYLKEREGEVLLNKGAVFFKL